MFLVRQRVGLCEQDTRSGPLHWGEAVILRSVEELPLKPGNRVLVRVDYNIPVNEEGLITDDARIKGTVDTLQYILGKGAIPIIISHWGRPQGDPHPDKSLARVVPELQKILHHRVNFLAQPFAETTRASVAASQSDELFLLENLRFHAGERTNDAEFARALAAYADYYVNDAFPVSHRKQASVSALPSLFKTPAAGFSLLREVEYFSRLIHAPEKPYVVIIGGRKIEDKVRSLRFLLDKVDEVLVGGASAFTVLRARGFQVGYSLVNEDLIDEMDDIADSEKVKLPTDFIAAPSYAEPDKSEVVPAHAFPEDLQGFDIGPETTKAFCSSVLEASTVLWFGPLGAYEERAFSKGSLEVTRAMAEATKKGATTVTGGGDSLAMLRLFSFKDSLSHASIGGGACLKFMEGAELPGIAPLVKER
ncbi:phosphoglycerate kinase [candidate division WOR-3 bacterium]|uniref:Phosphoglycerate kinase n=1 Tax=candidate division WOR-3 bacterium TaxID=2052148 RepID=A0A9D5QC17_UNCW3|nr:phosphoglycerate kinase [candidate division WOR-3 bacterium]MBD3364198.1 phosphoglycerate kinase [candidate division WOR-3 bacterium]